MKIANGRKLSTIIVFRILFSAIYGFAASNSVPESGAGDGSGTISGYAVTDIDYDLLSSSPDLLESVSMEVDASSGAGAASEVQITVDGGSTWISCSGPAGSTWTCTFGSGSEPTVLGVTSLQVIAVE